jgi:hypothetical protein
MMSKWLTMLLMIVILAACSPAQGSLPEVGPTATGVLEPAATETSTAVSIDMAEPTPTETAVPEPEQPQTGGTTRDSGELPAGDFIMFQQSGGFAGVDQKWVFYPDGQIELPDSTQKQVNSNQFQALIDTIQAADFFELNESYVPLDNCCDRFTYTITVQIDGQSKTVTTTDGAPKQPEQLTTIMNEINSLLTTSD